MLLLQHLAYILHVTSVEKEHHIYVQLVYWNISQVGSCRRKGIYVSKRIDIMLEDEEIALRHSLDTTSH